MNFLVKNKFWIIIDALLIVFIVTILTVPIQDANLIVTRSAISVDETGSQIISGTVENQTGDTTYSKVQIDLKYLNSAGQIVGQDVLQTNSLGPHMVWGFKAKVKSDNVANFQIKVSSLHLFGLRW